MQKTSKVFTLVSLAILSTNIIIGTSYVIDKNHFERELYYKDKIIKNNYTQYKTELGLLEAVNEELSRTIDDQSKIIDAKSSEIYMLQQQLEKSQVDSELPSVEFEITAYTAGYESTQKKKGDKGYGITASGTYVKEGRTIACPPSLEFGTKLNIEGIGLRVCEDRGGAIKEGHLDLYMDSLSAAIEFGRKTLSVEILNEKGWY